MTRPVRLGRWLLKAATQLGFAFKKRVQRPGSRGGHGYYDAHGQWQYGDRPLAAPHPIAATAPAPARTPETPAALLVAPPDPEAGRWPTEAKRFGEPGVQAWEVLEPDYVAQSVKRAARRMQGNVTFYAEELGKLGPRASTRRAQLTHWLAHWRQALARMEGGDVEAEQRQARLEYVQIVKLAVSKGRQVPQPVLQQNLEFRKARDARMRYEKGRRTSFGNLTAAVDRRMQESRGYKIKRQDGTPMTAAQRQEIATGMDEIEAVTGSLADVLRAIDVTVAHTSGTYPFLRQAGGLYSPDERTITMGIGSHVAKKGIPSLAHELAHCLDFEAGRKLGKQATVVKASWSNVRSYVTTSLAEVDTRDYATPREGRSLIQDATRAINRTVEVARTLKQRVHVAPTETEKVTIERAKVSLTPYWREPAEVFARLFEQYIATKANAGGVAMDAPGWYGKTPGWWEPEVFATFVPRIEHELQRRLTILRTGAEPSAILKARRWGRRRPAEPGATPVAPPAPELADLEHRRAAIERDLFELDDTDLPAYDDRSDNAGVIAKARLLTIRTALFHELGHVTRAIAKARHRAADAESRLIRTNTRTPAAQRRHAFEAAMWTHPNGHPRCLLCGDEPTEDGMCTGTDAILKARKLHYRRSVDGLAVSIENRRGSLRRWRDHDGSEGTTKLEHAYGYVRGTQSPADGEHLDVMLGPLARTGLVEATTVYLVTTNKPPDFGTADEQKAMIGFPSHAAARAAFLANYGGEVRFIRQIDAVPWARFKADARLTQHSPDFVRGDVVEHGGIHKAMMRRPTAAPARSSARLLRPAARPAPAEPAPEPSLDPSAFPREAATLLPILERALAQVADAFPGVPMAGRLKATATLADKVATSGGKDLDPVEDLASIRLVLDSEGDEQLAAQRLTRLFGATKVQDYTARPLGLGARGVDASITIEGRPIEVQLRTAHQIAWTDYAHDVAVRMPGAVPPEVATYLTAMSEAFAAADRGEAMPEAPPCPDTLQAMLGPLVAPMERAA